MKITNKLVALSMVSLMIFGFYKFSSTKQQNPQLKQIGQIAAHKCPITKAATSLDARPHLQKPHIDQPVADAVRNAIHGAGMETAEQIIAQRIHAGDISVLTTLVATISSVSIQVSSQPNHPEDQIKRLIEASTKTVAAEYIKGNFGTIGDIMQAVSIGDDKSLNIGHETLIQIFRSIYRSSDHDATLRAFGEICAQPPTRVDFASSLYEIAAAAAELGGYAETLSQIPMADTQKNDIFQYAVDGIIDHWMASNSIECSSYVKNLPEGTQKYIFAARMAINLARSGNISEAEQWIEYLPKGSPGYAGTREMLLEMKKTDGAPNIKQ